MGATCCCLSNSSTSSSTNVILNDNDSATHSPCKLVVVTSSEDRKKSSTNTNSTPQLTDSSVAGNSLGHLSPAVYGNDSHTNSDIIRPIIVSHSRNHSTSSGPFRRTKSVDGSPLTENIPHRQPSISGSSRDGVVRLGDPNQDSIKTPNADFDDLLGFEAPQHSTVWANIEEQPVPQQQLVGGPSRTSIPPSQQLQPKTPMWSGSDRGALSGEQLLPEGNSLFDFATTSHEVDLDHRLGSKSGSITSRSGNANTLFSFLEHVSTSSKPALDDDRSDVPGALFRMTIPADYSNSKTTDTNLAPLEQKSLTLPPPTLLNSNNDPSHVSSNYSSFLGNPSNNDRSVFESTDTTSSSTRQGGTLTDSPTTQAEYSGLSALMSIDGVIPGMDDGLMNGLTELPDNFFAQLGSAPFGGNSLGSPKASAAMSGGAFDGGSLFAIAGTATNDDDTPQHSNGAPNPLSGTDLDPRNTLLSWATDENRTPSHPTDQYPDIDYSDEAFLSKFGGNPLSTAATTGEGSQAQHQSEVQGTFHVEVASLFSLIPAEETSQFSFGGRKRVANPFGGRKNKGKLDRSIIFQPNNSWRELPTPKAVVDSAGESSTTNNGSSAAATTKDVITLEGRHGKKENPLIKYLKNDLEEEAASDGGSSSASSVDGAGRVSDTEAVTIPATNNDASNISVSATGVPTPALSSITSMEDQQRRLDRKEKKKHRKEERELRIREELEIQHRARVAAAAQRKEMNKQALREVMKKTLLTHPPIVAVARRIGQSVIQTSEGLADPHRRSIKGSGTSLMESVTIRGWTTGTPMNASPESQQQLASPDTNCNVASGGGAGQLFNIVLHQPYSLQSNGGVGDPSNHSDSIGASLLCAETKTTATALSNNTSVSNPRSVQPQEDWLVAVATDLIRLTSEEVESPLSPSADNNSPSITKFAANQTSLSKGEELLIEAVDKVCSNEVMSLVDAVVEQLPRNRRKQQAEIKSRNERCAWGMFHNPVVVKLADAIAAHVGSTAHPLHESSSSTSAPASTAHPSPSAPAPTPPSHSILFTGRSIVVEDPTSVIDPAYTEYLTPKAIDQMLRIPKRCPYISRAHIPCTPARSQVAPTSDSPHSSHMTSSDNSQSDALTATQVPVLVAGISSWARMPGSKIPKSIELSNLRAQVEGRGIQNTTMHPPAEDIASILSSMYISPTKNTDSAVHLASSPSMTSALSIPETTYIRSTHRSHAVVSFKPTVTLLTTKMASDCVVSISVPSAVMTTKRRKRSQSSSQSLNTGGALSSVTSLFSLGSDDVDTITNLVVHPVPYQMRSHQAPGNPQLIGPTVRPLIARHQELFAAAAAQALSEDSFCAETRSPALDECARAAGITEDDLTILMRLTAVNRRGISPPLNRSGSSNLNSSSGTRPKGSSVRSDTTTPSGQPVRAMGSSITSNTFRTSPHASLDTGRATGALGIEHADAVVRFGLRSSSLDDEDFVHEQCTFRGMTEDGKRQVASLPRGPAVGLILTNNGTQVAMSAPDLAVNKNAPLRGGGDPAGMQGSCSSGALLPTGSLMMHSRGYSEGGSEVGLLDLRKPGSAGGPSGSITSAPTSTSREVHPRRAQAIAAVRREQKQEARRISRVSSNSSRATTAEGLASTSTRRVSPRRAGSLPNSPRTSPTLQSSSINAGGSVDSGHISLFHIEAINTNRRNTELGTSTSSVVGGAGGRILHGNISLHNLSSAHASGTSRFRTNDSKLDSICSAASSRFRGISNKSNVADDIVSVGVELIIHAVDCRQRGGQMMAAKRSKSPPTTSSSYDALLLDDSEGEEEEALLEIPLLTNTNQEANFARHLTLQKSADGGVSMVVDGSGKGSSLETAGGLGGLGGLGGSVSQI